MKTEPQKAKELATRARDRQLARQDILNCITHMAHTQPLTQTQLEHLRQAYRLVHAIR